MVSVPKIRLYFIPLLTIVVVAALITYFSFSAEKAGTAYQPNKPQVTVLNQPSKKPLRSFKITEGSKQHVAPPSRARHAPPPIPGHLVKHSSENKEYTSEFVDSAQDLHSMDRSSLTQIIASSGNTELVHKAVWVIGNSLKLSKDEFATLLQRLENTDPSMEKLRKTLLWVLSLRPDLLPITRITEIATNDPSAIVRRGALRSLTKHKGVEIDRMIQTIALTDENKHNRIEALYFAGLGKSSVLNLATAEQAMMEENDPLVRRSWVAFLGNRYGEAAQEILYKTIQSQTEAMETRILAAQLLAISGRNHLSELYSDPSLPENIKNNLRRSNALD